MRSEAVEQYNVALKLGQKYMKNAILHGEYPYPLVLDEIVQESAVAGYSDLGVINIPTDHIVGTKSAGRINAFAGNFMPLLEPGTEFAAKWISLCEANLSEEGIRDPIQCYEFLGRFYVQEGNKRLSVLKSYLSPRISAHVTRGAHGDIILVVAEAVDAARSDGYEVLGHDHGMIIGIDAVIKSLLEVAGGLLQLLQELLLLAGGGFSFAAVDCGHGLAVILEYC